MWFLKNAQLVTERRAKRNKFQVIQSSQLAILGHVKIFIVYKVLFLVGASKFQGHFHLSAAGAWTWRSSKTCAHEQHLHQEDVLIPFERDRLRHTVNSTVTDLANGHPKWKCYRSGLQKQR